MNLLQGPDLENLIPKDQLLHYLEEVDQNGDGEIDFAEFQEMMAKMDK